MKQGKIYLKNCAFFLLIAAVLLLLACKGQVGQVKQEPQLQVAAGEQDLKVIYYGDRHNESRKEVNKRLKQAMEGILAEEISYVPIGEEIVIKAENFETEEFSITDYILKENGEIRYDEKVAQTSVIPVNDGAVSFPLPSHFAAFLSSDSEDYKPGKTIRGFVVRAEIDDAPFAFAFILRTDAEMVIETDNE